MKSKKYRHSRKKISKQKKHNTIKKRTRKYRKKGGVLFPGEKVKSFIMQRRPKMTSNFLKSICSDSGVCIAFGTESDKIKKFFNGFSSFDYVKYPIFRKSQGNNGFVSEIDYTRENYNANAILKSSIIKPFDEEYAADQTTDNLAYEYIVGQFLNKVGKFYPCFLETYGVFRYINDAVYTRLEKEKFSTVDMKNAVQQMNPQDPSFLADSCLYFDKLCILIQHLKHATSLYEILTQSFINKELLFVLYQIYMPLAYLADEFTHYDLHAGNVLLYKPRVNGFIEYHYHLSEYSTTSFKSQYLVKIIDYGRCFFYETKEHNSLALYNALCATQECDETIEATKRRSEYEIKYKMAKGTPRNCGVNNGYSILPPEESEGSFYFISSQKRNKSHDLRLLFNIKEVFDEFKKMLFNDDIVKFIKNVKYDHEYGTKETESRFGSDTIYNVEDAFEHLNRLVNSEQNKTINASTYSSFEKIGDLHIYTDGRPVEFIPATESPKANDAPEASALPVPNFSPSPQFPSPLHEYSPSPQFPSPLHENSPLDSQFVDVQLNSPQPSYSHVSV